MSMIVHIFKLRHTQSSESKLMLMYQYMAQVLKSNIIIVWHKVVITYDFVITKILSYINNFYIPVVIHQNLWFSCKPVSRLHFKNSLKTRLTQAVSNIYLRITFTKMPYNEFHSSNNDQFCMDTDQFCMDTSGNALLATKK